MKTLVHDIARLTGLSLLAALALTALVIATSHADVARAASQPAPIVAGVDSLEPAHTWPVVVLAVARPALRAARIAIVETIRVADLIVFRSYGVRRLAHFTGERNFDRFPWACGATAVAAARDDVGPGPTVRV